MELKRKSQNQNTYKKKKITSRTVAIGCIKLEGFAFQTLVVEM